MTQPLPAALPLAMTALLTGCLPAPYGVYYRPAYPDTTAQLSGAWCQGQAGPPARLSIQAEDGLSLALAAERGAAHPTPQVPWVLHVHGMLPAGGQFQFLSSALELGDAPAPAAPLRLAPRLDVFAERVSGAGEWIDLATQGPTDLAAAQQSLATDPAQTLAKVGVQYGEYPGFSPARLDLVWPAIELANAPGQPIASGPIAMHAHPPEKTYMDTVYRTQAQQLALVQRVQNCQAQTPERRCEQIPEGDTTSFRQRIDDFGLTGRVWASTQQALTSLHYQLEMDTRHTGAWRLSGSPLRWTDPDTGATRTTSTSTTKPVRVYWGYSVTLDTPVRASADKPTRFHLEIPLRAPEQPRYVLRLPPYLINGVRHEFKPIELERRAFDGGLQPFNC